MAQHGRYTVLRKLANGGMAEIFLATQQGHEGFQKPVVLKRILGNISSDPQFRNMLIDEAHISMGLTHSNIVQVLDLGLAGGRYFLALELVDGWDLGYVLHRSKLAGWPLPPPLGIFVVAEVCRALAYAHAKRGPEGRPLGIVHRDVSPNNVLISEHGEVKLTDFGIAKAMKKREHTGTGVVKGKVAFMSPEQGLGKPLDARSDLFSLGTLLYLVMTGVRPFEAPTDLEVLLRVQQAEFRSPAEVRPDLAPDVVQIILRAMQLDPQARYQSADAMLVDLERALRADYGGVGQTELKQYLAELERRDGIPPIARAQPLVESQEQSSGPALVEGNAVVLADASDAAAEEKTALSEVMGGSGGVPVRLTRRVGAGLDFSDSGPSGTLDAGGMETGRNRRTEPARSAGTKLGGIQGGIDEAFDPGFDGAFDAGFDGEVNGRAALPARGRATKGRGVTAGGGIPLRPKRRPVEELSLPDDADDDVPPGRYRRKKSHAFTVFVLMLIGAGGGLLAVRHFGWPVAVAAFIDHALSSSGLGAGTATDSRSVSPGGPTTAGKSLGGTEPAPAVNLNPPTTATRKVHPSPALAPAGTPERERPSAPAAGTGAAAPVAAPAAAAPTAPPRGSEPALGVGAASVRRPPPEPSPAAARAPAAAAPSAPAGAPAGHPTAAERRARGPAAHENEVFKESARRVRSLQGLEQYPPGTIQLSPPAADPPPAPPAADSPPPPAPSGPPPAAGAQPPPAEAPTP